MEQNNIETWKPVVGYEGRYEVSSFGRVRSLDLTYRNARNRLCTHLGRLLAGSLNPDGYRVFSVRGPDLDPKTLRVHVAVCTAFNGPKPSRNHEVNHKNFVRTDNRPENLEWVLHVENVRLSSAAGRMRALSGKKARNILLTPETALAIRAALEAGTESRSEIAERFSCNRHTVNEIALGKQWVIGAQKLSTRETANNPWAHPSRRRKLTAEQVLSLRSDRANGESVRSLALKYGVAVSTANDIVRGVSWAVTAQGPSVG